MDLNVAGLAAQSAANFDELDRIAREMIRQAESADDVPALALGYTFLGNAKLHMRDGAAAEEEYLKALALFEQLGDRHGIARVHMNLGAVAFDIHLDVETAREYFVKTLPVFREFGDNLRLGVALGNLSEVARLDGNLESAVDYAQRAYDVFESIGDSDRCTWMMLDIAHYHFLNRDETRAVESLHHARKLLAVNHNVIWTAVYFEIWMMIAVAHEAWDDGLNLLAFADAYRATHHVPRLQGMLPWLSPAIERLQKHHQAPTVPLDLEQAFAAAERIEAEVAPV